MHRPATTHEAQAVWPTRRRRGRQWIRAGCLIAATLVLSPLFGKTPVASGVASTSPHVTVGSLLAAHALPGVGGLGILVGLSILFRHRLFCRWICPPGLCLDGVGVLGRKCRRRSAGRNALGQWLVWLTLGGACVGYPLFLWLDPLALFSSAFSLPAPAAPLRRWVPWGIIVLLAGLTFLRPGIWCAQLCPLGAFQDSLYRWPRAIRRRLRERREASRDLADDPPGHAVRQSPAALESDLGVGKRQRAAALHDTGVTEPAPSQVHDPHARPKLEQEAFPEPGKHSAFCTRTSALPPARSTASHTDGSRWTRRAWLGATGGAAAAVVLPRLPGSVRPALRPPGALAGVKFSGVCLRCGNCVRACPAGIIRNAGLDHGWLGLLAPTLRFDSAYCREDCVRCTEVCPSGALQSLPLAAKPRVKLGRPQVNLDRCLLANDRECSVCRNRCPYGAITYVFSEETYMLVPRVDPDRCNGCGACQTYCPVAPVKAITVEPLPA